VIDFLETLISPLYWIVSVILMGWHWVFSQVLDPESGWTWALSIIGLTVVVRAALIPLFVKQIKSSRNMQMLQPKVKDLQKKYGHDRERLAQETMALYKDAGTNPFASCLPILAQAPIFFALFRVSDQSLLSFRRAVVSAHLVPLSYLLGRLEVERLHAQLVGREGWSLQQFNDWMLSHGAILPGGAVIANRLAGRQDGAG